MGGLPQSDCKLRSGFAKENDKQIELIKDDGAGRVAWAAEANNYFTCILAPAGRQNAKCISACDDRAHQLLLTRAEAGVAEAAAEYGDGIGRHAAFSPLVVGFTVMAMFFCLINAVLWQMDYGRNPVDDARRAAKKAKLNQNIA